MQVFLDSDMEGLYTPDSLFQTPVLATARFFYIIIVNLIILQSGLTFQAHGSGKLIIQNGFSDSRITLCTTSNRNIGNENRTANVHCKMMSIFIRLPVNIVELRI